MEAKHTLMLILALVVSVGMLGVLRWFFKRLRRIMEARWGQKA